MSSILNKEYSDNPDVLKSVNRVEQQLGADNVYQIIQSDDNDNIIKTPDVVDISKKQETVFTKIKEHYNSPYKRIIIIILFIVIIIILVSIIVYFSQESLVQNIKNKIII